MFAVNCGFENCAPKESYGEGELGNSSGVAIDGASGAIYVADRGADAIDVMSAPIIIPSVAAEPATEVLVTKATLNGTVNPSGLAVSECVFEYGETSSYGLSKPCEGALPNDEADHHVTAALTGLARDTTYHFRIVARNVNGTNRTPDRTFRTHFPVETGGATDVGVTTATVHGTVFPENQTVTNCRFEYGPTAALGSSAPCEGAIPADEGEHEVTAELSGLEAGSVYYFRIAAGIPSGPACKRHSCKLCWNMAQK